MRRNTTLIILAIFLVLISCNGDKDKIVVGGFIGGTEGINLEFQNLRKEVYDVDDQFDVVVKLENKGEYDVEKSKIKVELSGIKPTDFGLKDEDAEKQPSEDAIGQHKDINTDATSQGGPIVVEFNNMQYLPQVTGAQLEFPIKAEVCYSYKTTAVSKYCVRSDLVNPKEGLCALTEDKPVQNSGAPVQIQNLKQTTRGSDKISFSFEVVHAGKGNLFKQASQCLEERKNMDKVQIAIDVGKEGLSCTGLDLITNNGVEGTKTLHDGKATITCTLDFQKKELRDYEAPITIKADYDYASSIQDTITVKSSESTK